MTAIVVARLFIEVRRMDQQQLTVRLHHFFRLRLGRLAGKEQGNEWTLRPIKETSWERVVLYKGDPAPVVERVLQASGCRLLAEARQHRLALPHDAMHS